MTTFPKWAPLSKKERIKRRIYRARELAKADVDYIEVFCNRTRRHSHFGGVSPEAFEGASQLGGDNGSRRDIGMW
jgi:hypothetical protein